MAVLAGPPPPLRYLLCPSAEGCHRIARPWSRPLGDFAVDEFLALTQLFGGPPSPLGGPAAVAQARVQLRHSIGPWPVQAALSSEVAQRVASRLTAVEPGRCCPPS
jgi:hypothetical protein